jgi:hypothetical protein
MRRNFFNDFVMEFDHRFAQHFQHGGPTGGQVVVTPSPFPLSHSDFGTEPPVALQPFQERIERTGADVVAVSAQLGENPLTDDRMLGGVVEDVDFPKTQQDLACQQLQVKCDHQTPPRCLITTIVNECAKYSLSGRSRGPDHVVLPIAQGSQR